MEMEKGLVLRYALAGGEDKNVTGCVEKAIKSREKIAEYQENAIRTLWSYNASLLPCCARNIKTKLHITFVTLKRPAPHPTPSLAP